MNLNDTVAQAAASAVQQLLDQDCIFPKWMPPEVAARYCGTSKFRLAKARERGTGPAYHKMGARVVYRRDDLDQWLESLPRYEPKTRG